MVTVCTASLTFNNSTFCAHSVFMCFVWIWEQTAIISLYSINWLVCITETECVYWAVRNGSLNQPDTGLMQNARKRLAVRRDSAMVVPKRACWFILLSPRFREQHLLFLRCKALSRFNDSSWCTKSISNPVSGCQAMSCLANGSPSDMILGEPVQRYLPGISLPV